VVSEEGVELGGEDQKRRRGNPTSLQAAKRRWRTRASHSRSASRLRTGCRGSTRPAL